MKDLELKKLIKKYETGNATPEEAAWLESWYVSYARRKSAIIYPENLADRMNKALPLILSAKQDVPLHKNHAKRLWFRIAAAASILIAFNVGGYFYVNKAPKTLFKNAWANDVKPGKRTATLILANGKKIVLSDAANGELVRESGVVITKAANGQLIYQIDNHNNTETNAINTLTTAKGETYQIRLPDGTTIWLNAASTLKYPASFAGLKSRNVALQGEAYFNVAKDKKHPFIVKTDQQAVEVLGTQFNINSYADEPAIKTTLLEGSVKIVSDLEKGSPKILKPGQQAELSAAKINIDYIDTELAVAWKNDRFIFENNDIRFIMRMVERWYNVKVNYVGAVPLAKFTGAVPRFENVSHVLRILASTDKVRFKIEGRNIYVSK